MKTKLQKRRRRKLKTGSPRTKLSDVGVVCSLKYVDPFFICSLSTNNPLITSTPTLLSPFFCADNEKKKSNKKGENHAMKERKKCINFVISLS